MRVLVAGGIGIITTIIWMLFVYDDPSRHPHISFTEKVYLMETTAMRNGENVSVVLCGLVKSSVILMTYP